ncbi:MAG TPA: hypothetical protein VIM89_05315 [Mucilaginibacter sp.]
MNAAKGSVILTTIYLIVYAILINLSLPQLWVALMGILWPFIFIWMICAILKDTQFKYPELKDEEE